MKKVRYSRLGSVESAIIVRSRSDLKRKAKMRMKEAEFWKVFETKVVEEGLKIYICENYFFENCIVEAMDPFRIDLTFTSYTSK